MRDGTTTLFVMPSVGVAERVAEILAEYEIEARLSVAEEPSASERYRANDCDRRPSERGV